jgi:hypothetical protein
MKYFLRIGALSVFTVLTVFGGLVAAQEDQATGGTGFRLSPAREELTIEKGESKTSKITVSNITSQAQTARAVIDDFGPSDDESGTPRLLIGSEAQENYAFSIKPFVLKIDDIKLKPGEQKEVSVTLSIPETAAPGSYFGVVRFVTVNDENITGDDGTAAVALNASVGTIYLIQVPGETVDLVSLEQISALNNGKSGSLFSTAPDAIMVRLKNEGNTFQAPFGKVKVKNWSGDVIYEYEINDTAPRGNILPDSIRRFEDPIEGVGSFGRFTIEANLSYGNGGNIITSTTTFWVIPWMTVLAVMGVLVVIAFLGTRGLKSYNRHVIEATKGVRVKKK